MISSLLSACGGSGSSSQPDTPSSPPPAPPVSPPPAPAPVAAAEITLLAGDINATKIVPRRAEFSQPKDVAVDSAGNIYVLSGLGVAHKITPDGTVTALTARTFPNGTPDGPAASSSLYDPTAIAADRNGVVYIADGRAVRKIADGKLTTVAGHVEELGWIDGPGASARFGNIRDLEIDTDGNLYVVDGETIRRVTPAGVVSTVAGRRDAIGSQNGPAASATFGSLNAIVIDAAHNLYVADYNQVRKITPAGQVSTIATAAPGVYLSAIAVDANGTIYSTQEHSGAVYKLGASGSFDILAGRADAWGFVDGAGDQARFSYRGKLAITPDGKLAVTDGNNSVVRLVSRTGEVSTVGDPAPVPYTPVDATGAAARLSYPGLITSDAAGNVYLAEGSTVRKVSPAGAVTTLAGTFGARGTADGRGAAARFVSIDGITVDLNGNVFVVDTVYCVQGLCGELTNASSMEMANMRKITPAGEVTTMAGSAAAIGSADGAGAVARFWMSSGLTTDSSGNVYIADCGNGALRKMTQEGVVSTVARDVCSASYFSMRPSMQTSAPSGVAMDRDGNAFVASSVDHVIRKITPAGVVSVVAGAVNTRGAVDGIGAAARFDTPIGIVVDAGGNLFVADSNNHAVRKITPTGQVTTYAGKLGTSGIVLGKGAGGLERPLGIALLPDGALAVSTASAIVKIR